MAPNSEWADELHEGVLQVEGTRVRWLNLRAAELLEVDRAAAVGAPLISVLRDHRLERVAIEGGSAEVPTRGRVLLARSISGGLALLDVSEARHRHEEARNLLAVLSHELRTPATTVSSALEALRLELDEQERSHFLDRAQSECGRLVRLLQDLTVETAPPRERRLELQTVVERAGRILEGPLAERRVELTSDLPEVLVWADEDKLLQVILNLLENALRHGPSNEQVAVTAWSGEELVTVRVHDHGQPLATDSLPGLFEPHASSGSGRRGSGMGLYIVRSLVEQWGGRVWGESGETGNAFLFTVALAKE